MTPTATRSPIPGLWSRRPPGSTAVLTGATTTSPTFVADKKGQFVAQLVVNDGKVNSLPSSVTISTVNTKPVANAGPNQAVAPTGTGTTGWLRIHRRGWRSHLRTDGV